jgi:hypothetical protein
MILRILINCLGRKPVLNTDFTILNIFIIAFLNILLNFLQIEGSKPFDRGENVKYSMAKCILQIDPKNNTIKDAEKQLNLPVGNISKCINGKRNTAGGFIWKQKQ